MKESKESWKELLVTLAIAQAVAIVLAGVYLWRTGGL